MTNGVGEREPKLFEPHAGFLNPDFARAGQTGITRGHWIALADGLIADALARGVPGAPWNIQFPGPSSENGVLSDRLESTARTMILAGYRASATERPMATTMRDQLLEVLEGGAKAIAEGRADRWPDPSPRTQAFVESASLAIALLASPDEFWDPLSESAKVALREWFSEALSDIRPSNNWVLFPGAVAAFLERHARGFKTKRARGAVDRAVDVADRWYVGDGVYSDGLGSRFDYYNAWSFHYYLPLIAYFRRDERRTKICAERLSLFTPKLVSMFDRTGAPVYFGRSLIYRFGSLAPLWIEQLIGGEGVDPGVARLTSSRVLNFFMSRGAAENGYLSVGWEREDQSIAQRYSSGGSPLWAAKAFAGLLLPAEDDAWTADEAEPLAVSRRFIRPGFSVGRDDVRETSILQNLGIEAEPIWRPTVASRAPLYSRLAYSSCTRPIGEDGEADNSVELLPSPAPHRSKRFFRSTEHQGGVAVMSFHRKRGWLEPPAQFLADRFRRFQRAWVPRVGELVLGAWIVGDIEIRAFAPLGCEVSRSIAATTWPIEAAEEGRGDAGREIQLRGSETWAQTAILHGFEDLYVSRGPASFVRCEAALEDAGWQCFVLATRLSRGPIAEPLLSEVSVVGGVDSEIEVRFASGEVVHVAEELASYGRSTIGSPNDQ